MIKHQDILEHMTLEEKAAFLSGKNEWQSRDITRLGIPSIFCSDGPHGIRKQVGAGDHLGLNESVPATCFPTAATIANSWDEELGRELGAALGEEAAAQEVDILLGPGLNIKRSPLCGRNFEYFSEDPYLAGKLAAAYVKGIQSQGVFACPKHFAVNSQELRRMAMDSVLDERTLREIYLTGFEIAVKEGNAKAIMSSYNEVNGIYANENKHLLQEILRDEWGFTGIVVTDWGASNDHAKGASAMLDLITGKANPSGRLNETYPLRYEDTPAYRNFPSTERTAEYRESIYIGYRYYDSSKVRVQYPFGFGLSYTTFEYSDLKVNDKGIQVTISNTGSYDGAEVVQLYVGLPNAIVFRPEKELKGFARVFLKKGEQKEISIPFDDKTFRYWNVKTNQWEIEMGTYEIMVGASVSDIRLNGTLAIEGTTNEYPYNPALLPYYYTGLAQNIGDREFETLLGRPIPSGKWSGELGLNDAICQMYYAKSGLARFLYNRLTSMKKKSEDAGKPDLNILFIYNMPFRALAKMTGGMVSMEMAEGMLDVVNGHFIKGVGKVIGGFFRNRKANKDYEKRLGRA